MSFCAKIPDGADANVACRDYKKITYDYPVAAANAFTGLSDPFKFVYVSGRSFPIPPLKDF